jgi:hypothetical protein
MCVGGRGRGYADRPAPLALSFELKNMENVVNMKPVKLPKAEILLITCCHKMD